jgi:hypothetical protein
VKAFKRSVFLRADFMTTEIDRPIPASQPAPAVADAAVLQPVAETDLPLDQTRRQKAIDDVIAALFARDTVIRHPLMLPAHLQECAVALLSIATLLMAEKKNVPLTAEDGRKLAAATADSLNASVVRGLLDAEASALLLVTRSINRVLDIIAAIRVLDLIGTVEGFKQVDAGTLALHAAEWVSRMVIANDVADARYLWPEPAQMIADYCAARALGPVWVHGAVGQAARATYCLGNRASDSAMAVPLLIRYPCLSQRSARGHSNGAGADHV